MTNPRPVHECRIGRIVASIWENSTARGARHSVTLSRLYKSEESSGWQRSESFWRDHLPIVEKVADLAFRWINEQEGSGKKEPA